MGFSVNLSCGVPRARGLGHSIAGIGGRLWQAPALAANSLLKKYGTGFEAGEQSGAALCGRHEMAIGARLPSSDQGVGRYVEFFDGRLRLSGGTRLAAKKTRYS